MRIEPRCTHRRVPGSMLVGAGDASGIRLLLLHHRGKVN